MNALANLQRAMQSFVLDANTSAETEIVSTATMSAAARLNIYGEAYRLRLIEALASNYPRLKQAMGEEFNAVAFRYVELHRSCNPSIRWYGEQLAEFLSVHRPQDNWLHELARWEWAVATAFDAADAATIDASALALVQPEQWAELRLIFHPSLQRLDLDTNAVAVFKALTEEDSPPDPKTAKRAAWLIWRQELKTRYRSLQSDEAAVFDSMRIGGSFAQACELLCDWHNADEVPLRAATYMQQWIQDRLVCALG